MINPAFLVLLALLTLWGSCGSPKESYKVERQEIPFDNEFEVLLERGSHALPWPEGGKYRVTRGYHTHSYAKEKYAIDFGTKYDQIVASHSGWVRRIAKGSTTGGCAASYSKYVNLVVIYWDDGSGKESLYLHFSKVNPALQVGSYVERGQWLGNSGNTGYSCGAHLHYQVQTGAKSRYDTTTTWWLQSIEAIFVEGYPSSGKWMTSQN